MESLERSKYECGLNRQFSGFGSEHVFRKREKEQTIGHVSRVFRALDEEFTDGLERATLDSFPIKRLYNTCQLYSSVWANRPARAGQLDKSALQGKGVQGEFPYVDDRVTVLSELTKANIMQSRHRVNSESHPKWALRTIRRRRRKLLVKAKRRSIAQEATRSLQAKLLANQRLSKKT
jgi:hypothetical protein